MLKEISREEAQFLVDLAIPVYFSVRQENHPKVSWWPKSVGPTNNDIIKKFPNDKFYTLTE